MWESGSFCAENRSGASYLPPWGARFLTQGFSVLMQLRRKKTTRVEAHAVKAMIYDSGGRLLLQQRDQNPKLLFPGCWTFFGGLVEPKENMREALKRELLEELGCCPGPIEEELFTWAWYGQDRALNHVFSVPLLVSKACLSLNEGQAMGWFSLRQIYTIKSTPLITANVHYLKEYLKKFKK